MTETKPKIKPKSKKDYIYAVGKRRTASARARLFRGKGETTVNGKLADKYFPGAINKDIWTKPFRVLDVTDKYYATIRVLGGGIKGQLEATAHAIAKALLKVEKENFRPLLKKAGLLTRDSRIRQRRMVGTGGKSRRAKQSPKR